jgi:hypothetical protein
MLEYGMTTDDKRNLWAVIKISQDTAKAEEQNRQKQAQKALQFSQVTVHLNTQAVVTAFGFIPAVYRRYTLHAVCSVNVCRGADKLWLFLFSCLQHNRKKLEQ